MSENYSPRRVLFMARAQILQALNDHVPNSQTPHAQLWIHAIDQAIFDAFIFQPAACRGEEELAIVDDAREFLETGRLNTVCDMLHIETDYVRSLVEALKKLRQPARRREAISRSLDAIASAPQQSALKLGSRRNLSRYEIHREARKIVDARKKNTRYLVRQITDQLDGLCPA